MVICWIGFGLAAWAIIGTVLGIAVGTTIHRMGR